MGRKGCGLTREPEGMVSLDAMLPWPCLAAKGMEGQVLPASRERARHTQGLALLAFRTRLLPTPLHLSCLCTQHCTQLPLGSLPCAQF